MRRRCAIYTIGFLLITLSILCVHWYVSRPVHRINESSIAQIKKGMTLPEVEAILGVPAGDYSTRPVLVFGSVNNLDLSGQAKAWTSNEASTRIFFDGNHCVLLVIADQVWLQEESWWRRLQRWLRLE